MYFLSELTNPNYWIMLLYSIPAILLALSFHEAAHAWAAYKNGDPTARNLGRMTLDPTKHLDLLGTICMLLFRFGWAKPVPINPRNFKNVKKGNAMVALAGITVNLLLSFAAAAVLFIVLAIAIQGYQGSIQDFFQTYAVFIRITVPVMALNLTLCIFNILPIPPLDGFQLVSTFFFRKAYKVVSVLNRYGFIILIVLLVTGIISMILSGFISFMINAYDSFFGLFAPNLKGLISYAYGFAYSGF